MILPLCLDIARFAARAAWKTSLSVARVRRISMLDVRTFMETVLGSLSLLKSLILGGGAILLGTGLTKWGTISAERFGPRISPRRYAAWLGSPNPSLRAKGAEALGILQNADDLTLAMLRKAVQQDPHLLVRLCAAQALAKMKRATPEVTGVILAAIRCGDSLIREKAVKVVPSVRGLPLILAQLDAIGDKSTDVSEAAVEGLVELLRSLPRDAVSRMIQMQVTSENRVTKEFQQVLERGGILLKDESINILEILPFFLEEALAADPVGRASCESALHGLLRSHPQIVAALGLLVKDAGEKRPSSPSLNQALGIQQDMFFWERMKSLEKLVNVRHPDRQVFEKLLETVRRDNNIWVRTKALEVLQRLTPPDRQILSNLSEAYQDEGEEIREKIIETMGQVGDGNHPRFIEFITEVLRLDPSPQVRQAAARVLRTYGRTDSDITSAFLQALSDKDDQVRGEAATALGEMGSEETLKDLCRLWERINHSEIFLALDSLSRRFKQKIWQEGRRRRLFLIPVDGAPFP